MPNAISIIRPIYICYMQSTRNSMRRTCPESQCAEPKPIAVDYPRLMPEMRHGTSASTCEELEGEYVSKMRSAVI